jgi:MHS family alpha-ketoglutarate permease-like MFS transporter
VLLMGGGSVGIACIPPHSAIGTLAPLLLLVARSIQGLSIGGEYGASATYLTEMAAAERRGFYSSFQYVTLIAGQLIALCVLLVLQAALPPSDLERWGWRIPFLLGGALAVGVYLVRRRLDETAAFQKAVRSGAGRSGGLALFRHHPRAVAQVIGLTAGGTLAFYAYSTYMQKFLVNTAGFARETATAIMAGALFIYMLIQPLAGALSDRVGRRPLLLGFGVVGMLATVPIFSALERAPSAGAAFFLVLAGLMLTTGYTAINAVVKAELFPAHIRALGVALPYALANTLFGGTAEYVALWLKQAGIERSFYYYVSAMIAVSLIVVLRMADTRHANRMAE